MLLQSFNHKPFALAAMTALAAACLPVSAAYADGPFSRFAGAWYGNGTISMRDGTRERIRCRVRYSVASAGTVLNQDLVCASESYKFDVKSQVQAQGGQLSGSWTETSRNVTGSVSGQVTPGTIRAIVTGATFSAGLSLAVRGGTQYVQIRPSGTTDVAGVSVALRRR